MTSRSLNRAGSASLCVFLLSLSVGCAGRPAPGADGSVADAGSEGRDSGSDGGRDGGRPPDGGPPDAGPPELRVRRLLPPRGASAGGTPVLIEGAGFLRDFATSGTAAKGLTTVKFGSNPVIDLQIIDDTTMEVRTPPGSPGAVSVSVQNPNGRFVCGSCFTWFEELLVTGLSPAEGPLAGGNELTLEGQGLTSGVEVLFGGRSSPRITLVSSTHLRAMVPRGAAPELVDVLVYSKNGASTLRRAYRYLEELRVFGATPLTGPFDGGTALTIAGRGFSAATAVRLGAASPPFTIDSDGQISLTTPSAAGPGAVDVTVVTSGEVFTARRAFTYIDPAGAWAVFALRPRVIAPGHVVTLTGQALDSGALAVAIGGEPAVVRERTFSTATLVVPARGSSPRRADVVATGSSSLTLFGGATWRLTLAGVTPISGPATGGMSVRVTGSDLPPDPGVVVGALSPSRINALSEHQLEFSAPPGSSGATSDLQVFEQSDPENEAALTGAFTYLAPLAIGRVQPERGAIAGGTLVTVVGAGFGEGTVVSFGGARAKDLKVIDSHTLSCRIPKGEVGTVDVTVERLQESDGLTGGFSYYDPRSISGGLSGGPLLGTLNVTVLDSTPGLFGAPLPQAAVMLGLDSDTPFQGLTDARGQITFSDPSLVATQAVTVFKADYESTTVAAVNAENVTVFIGRTGGGEGNPGNPPPGVPASTISGRVTGFKAPRPLAADEFLEARVFVAQTSLYSWAPFRGPPNKSRELWRITQDGGEYLVFTGAGLRATYAVLGIVHRSTNTFTPVTLGVRRGITTSPDHPAQGQDIVLNLQLDVTVPITLDAVPRFPSSSGPVPGQSSVYAWLDLGAEGFVPNPNNWNSGLGLSSSVRSTSARVDFPNFPRLDGTNFVFLTHALGSTATPESYFFRRQLGDLRQGVTIGPMLPVPVFTAPAGAFSGVIAWRVEPGAVPNLHQVQILKPTPYGNISVWNVVLPGTETRVELPPVAVQKLREEARGTQLTIVMYSSRSPKFSYSQWTYDTLDGVTWSSYTIALSAPFAP